MTNKTPLYDNHLKAHAMMIDFFGWEMPIHYGSQVEEHHFVRKNTGLFDVSHMTIVDFFGSGVKAYLQYLFANDVDKLKENGRALYSCMLNERGGIIDDLIVYRMNEDFYRVIVNSATREKDLTWMRSHLTKNVEMKERFDLSIVSLQGKEAIALAKRSLDQKHLELIDKLDRPFYAAMNDDLMIARTGYTGEDGLEFILPANEAGSLWEKLVKAGAHPCGLGARDTLRLEAGLNLYGQDMDETVTPFESNIAWTVSLENADRQFIGRGVLESQRKNGIKKKLVGLVLCCPGVLRHGQKVFKEDKEVGVITSGGFSPSLQKGIAMARIDDDVVDDCLVEVRGKRLLAKIIRMPFIRRGMKTFEE